MMSWLTNALSDMLVFILAFLDEVLPAYEMSPTFVTNLDNTFTFVISMLDGASYFIPLDIFVTCFFTLLSIDMFALTYRIAMKVVSLIRGGG